MERREDLQQIRELHLIRDERDRMEETAGGDFARQGVLLSSQVLAAVCMMQRNTAWLLLLSLTFISAAMGNFYRYVRDRARMHLILGTVSAMVAAALWAGFFLHPHSGEFPLGTLVAYGVLCSLLTTLSGLLFLGALLAAVWLKHRVFHMNGEQWEAYFRSLPTARLLLRGGTLLLVVLILVALGGFYLFSKLGFSNPGLLAFLFFISAGSGLLGKLGTHREEIVRKMLRFKA